MLVHVYKHNFDLMTQPPPHPPPTPRAVLVSWVMDLDDLEKKAATSKAKVLLLSHMRSKVRLTRFYPIRLV